ncbi:hypothetical protein L7F22_045904 [Adiantum nelumboides]|nr:hypothetical protein [Adiantum nelumboides]
MLPLPPSRPLFPSSLKFLWFGRDNPSQAPDHTSSKPLDAEDSEDSKDLAKSCFIDTVDSDSHSSNLSDAVHMVTIQTSNLEDRDEVDKQVAVEIDSAIPQKHVITADSESSGWLSRLLQLQLQQKGTNTDQLQTSEGLVDSALLTIAGKEADQVGEDFTKLH